MTTLFMIIKSTRDNILFFIKILLVLSFLTSCNSSVALSNLDVTKFSQELQKVVPKLSSNDHFVVKQAISEIPLSHDPYAVIFLEELWDRKTIPNINFQPGMLKSPIVRSKIAHGLISLGKKDSKYIDYIKQLVNDQDITVQIVGIEALRDIGDTESMELLSSFATHSDSNIAEIAISGIRHYIDYGQNKEYAITLWKKIKTNPSVERSIVEKYDKMYGDYMRSIKTK